MIESRIIEVENFRLAVTLSTINGEAHSKVGDNPLIIQGIWGNIIDALHDADEEVDNIPSKVNG